MTGSLALLAASRRGTVFLVPRVARIRHEKYPAQQTLEIFCTRHGLPSLSPKCGATARCSAHYERLREGKKRRRKKTEERGRRVKKTFREKPLKKIDEENP
ncbi:MAG: hypothetical protein KA191_18035 [Verrucomicrobia bacterium]|jgi:hypothetical protein|nr:hypothetical protein [Verrucomicrobiota bacterium]